MPETFDWSGLFPEEPEDPKADGGPKSPIGDLSFLGSRRVLPIGEDPESFASNLDDGGCTEVPEVGNKILFYYQDCNGNMQHILGTVRQRHFGKKGWTFYVTLSLEDRNKHGVKECHVCLNEKENPIITIISS